MLLVFFTLFSVGFIAVLRCAFLCLCYIHCTNDLTIPTALESYFIAFDIWALFAQHIPNKHEYGMVKLRRTYVHMYVCVVGSTICLDPFSFARSLLTSASVSAASASAAIR